LTDFSAKDSGYNCFEYLQWKMQKQLKLMIFGAIAVTLVFTTHRSVLAQPKVTLLESQRCISEARLRSESSLVSTNILFINRKPFPVKVYWIDFTGKRQHYFDLEPNQVRWQQTFTTHPWVITNTAGNQPCQDVFLPPSLTDGVAIID
jgi:hypothetical protein